MIELIVFSIFLYEPLLTSARPDIYGLPCPMSYMNQLQPLDFPPPSPNPCQSNPQPYHCPPCPPCFPPPCPPPVCPPHYKPCGPPLFSSPVCGPPIGPPPCPSPCPPFPWPAPPGFPYPGPPCPHPCDCGLPPINVIVKCDDKKDHPPRPPAPPGPPGPAEPPGPPPLSDTQRNHNGDGLGARKAETGEESSSGSAAAGADSSAASKRAKLFTSLFSLPGMVADSLLSGEISL